MSVFGRTFGNRRKGVIRLPLQIEPVLTLFEQQAAEIFEAPAVRLVPVSFENRVLSSVLRLAVLVPGENSPRTHAYVKLFKPRPSHRTHEMRARVVNDFESTRRVHEGMRAFPDMGSVRPLACYPDHLAIVTEETVGETLADFIGTRARWIPGHQASALLVEVLARTGRWVRTFQALDPQPATVSLNDLMSYVDVRLQRLVREPLAQVTERDRSRILRHMDALGREVPSSALSEVSVHADLALGNVLVSSGRVVVLDFAMVRRGNLMHDVSRLFVQIELLSAKPQFRRRTLRTLQQALLRGFDPELTDAHPLFRLLTLLHRINHLNTLAVRRERFPARMYNVHLRGLHHRWLARELQSTAGMIQ